MIMDRKNRPIFCEIDFRFMFPHPILLCFENAGKLIWDFLKPCYYVFRIKYFQKLKSYKKFEEGKECLMKCGEDKTSNATKS